MASPSTLLTGRTRSHGPEIADKLRPMSPQPDGGAVAEGRSSTPIRTAAASAAGPRLRRGPASAASRPGTWAAPSPTSNLAPAKSWPIGSARPPRCAARNASAMALKEMRFSGTAKPCPSSGIEHVGDRQVLGAHGRDDLVGLGLLDARVVGALADQQRLRDLVGGVQRRALLSSLRALLGARIADAPGTGSRRTRPSRAGWSPAASRGWTGRRCRRRSRTPRA